jgi:hypothetical protein
MEVQELIEKEEVGLKNRVHSVIEKWKQSRAEEEERFQKKLKDPEFIANLESLRGKMNQNDSPSS